jgi:hypothetical protein
VNNLDLDDLRLAGNHLSGVLPQRILNKWEAGPLRLSGYASQFTTQIDEIILRRRTAVLCTDYEATLRPDGSVTMRSEKCRGSAPNPKVYCEIKIKKAGWIREEVDRLVRFMETSGFFELESGYFAPMTHGGTFEIEVLRRGLRQKVAIMAGMVHTDCGRSRNLFKASSKESVGTRCARLGIVASL